METSSGKPFDVTHVIAVNGADTGRRIVMDTGEVLTDHWETREIADSFTQKVKLAMRGIQPERGAEGGQ